MPRMDFRFKVRVRAQVKPMHFIQKDRMTYSCLKITSLQYKCNCNTLHDTTRNNFWLKFVTELKNLKLNAYQISTNKRVERQKQCALVQQYIQLMKCSLVFDITANLFAILNDRISHNMLYLKKKKKKKKKT